MSGTSRLSSMDLLSSIGLINYFGKWRDLSEVEISPIILQKKNTKVALYGLSHIHDARLARLFHDHKVKVRKPDIKDDEIFSLMVLHQNRAERGRLNYLPEDKLPGFIDFVVWGHEHDCRIQPEDNGKIKAKICQPGSSVATSLSEGESIEKKIGILDICKTEHRLNPITLKTVRPFIFRSVNVEDYIEELQLNEGDAHSKIEMFYCKKIEEMIVESKKRISGHPKQPKLPLIRLRIMFNNDNQVLNIARFGQKYEKRVANPESILAFKKNIKRSKADVCNLDEAVLESAFNKKSQQDCVEDVIETYFNELQDENDKLQIFTLKSLTEVCRLLVEKEDDQAVATIFKKHYDNAIAFMSDKMCNEEDILETIQEFHVLKSKDAFNEAVIENSRMTSDSATSKVSNQRQFPANNHSVDYDDRNKAASSFKAPPTAKGRSRDAPGAAKSRGRRKTPTSVSPEESLSSALNIKRVKSAATKTHKISMKDQLSQRSQRSSTNNISYVNSSDSD